MDENQALTLVGQIYDAALGAESWDKPLCGLAHFCGAENAALVMLDENIAFSSVIAPRADPAVISEYNRHWWRFDPTAKATALAHPGKITTLADTGWRNYLTSTFHNEFWSGSGLGAERLATNLHVDDGELASCVLHCAPGRDAVEDENHGRFALFIPHLVRGVHMARTLHRLELEKTLAARSAANGNDAVMLVDSRGCIVMADARVEEMLRFGDGISVAGGVLRLTDPDADAWLRLALANCQKFAVSSSQIDVRRERSGSQFKIEILPWRGQAVSLFPTAGGAPAAIIVLHDVSASHDARLTSVRKRFGLTQAEAVLTLELIKGDGRAAAAARCGISVNTARTHLTRIFEKTGISRQGELIRLLSDS